MEKGRKLLINDPPFFQSIFYRYCYTHKLENMEKGAHELTIDHVNFVIISCLCLRLLSNKKDCFIVIDWDKNKEETQTTIRKCYFKSKIYLDFSKVGLVWDMVLFLTQIGLGAFLGCWFSIAIPFSEEIETTSDWKKLGHLLHILLQSWKLNLFQVAITTKQARNSAKGHQILFVFAKFSL